ncbi:hypothetical protein HBI81_005470 [Parastagonospora nodorum]|nr:hypothetical protein HBH93_077220 [Parastagonospora nodorum]KAH4453748.1 hypothetical protein HBH91_105450 [Parastagonospora nodorum]KAH4510509.1 hypothetical protein HBH89_055760 [Parastagonospora nodorum]KAH4548076.1 hypothetical protein HBH85_063260 [Parastagonospora nodorum]KAH4876139.1 hypothetical protein HBH59_090340 [Parastagonospora nodorum]
MSYEAFSRGTKGRASRLATSSRSISMTGPLVRFSIAEGFAVTLNTLVRRINCQHRRAHLTSFEDTGVAKTGSTMAAIKKSVWPSMVAIRSA